MKPIHKTKTGILAVSFGTTYHQVCQASIEACEKRIAESFPDLELRRAFTSNIIRRILSERDGVIIPDTRQALEEMKKEGFEHVVVQPLHIIPGEEYHDKVLQPARLLRGLFTQLTVGRPLLTTIEDYRQAVLALQTHLPKLAEGQAYVLMGHGSTHPANASYSCLQLMLQDTWSDVYVATVEGYPELADILPKLKDKKIQEVVLTPYMLVAGDHAINDMAGEEENSWKSVLERAGFSVKILLKGLGEYPIYQEMFVARVRDCLAGNPLGQ